MQTYVSILTNKCTISLNWLWRCWLVCLHSVPDVCTCISSITCMIEYKLNSVLFSFFESKMANENHHILWFFVGGKVRTFDLSHYQVLGVTTGPKAQWHKLNSVQICAKFMFVMGKWEYSTGFVLQMFIVAHGKVLESVVVAICKIT